jgi:tRNA G18 (ribose-2'-O)-methylase SpoU
MGIWHANKSENVGTLFRSSYAFSANYIYTIGRKYDKQASDTPNSNLQIPYFHFVDSKDFLSHVPKHARIVCIEIDDNAYSLPNFCHPEQAVYLLGSECGGLPREILEKSLIVQIPSRICLNVATAGSIVLYDRRAKNERKSSGVFCKTPRRTRAVFRQLEER